MLQFPEHFSRFVKETNINISSLGEPELIKEPLVELLPRVDQLSRIILRKRKWAKQEQNIDCESVVNKISVDKIVDKIVDS